MYIAKHDRGSVNTLGRVSLGAENILPHTRCAEQGIAKLVVLQDVLDALKKEDVGVGMSLVWNDGKLGLEKQDITNIFKLMG